METKYGIIKQVNFGFPFRGLLVVPHKSGSLVVSYPEFGPDYFRNNVAEMRKGYLHPQTGEKISFREPTTSESISAASYYCNNFFRSLDFGPNLFRLGYIVRAQDGVFTNAINKSFNYEKPLNQLLNGVKKVNGVYLFDDGLSFAPYETFKQGFQDWDSFCKGGLARALEHTDDKVAEKLREISSSKLYNKGVNVRYFHKSKKPVLGVVYLGSSGHIGSRSMDIYRYGEYENIYYSTFGVCEDA